MYEIFSRDAFQLLQKNIEVKEVPLNQACLDSTDVFILDLGETVYQVQYISAPFKPSFMPLLVMMIFLFTYKWNGDGANKDERFKAATYTHKIKVLYYLTMSWRKQMMLLAISCCLPLQSERGKCKTETLGEWCIMPCFFFPLQPAACSSLSPFHSIAFWSFNIDERDITKSHAFYSYLSTDPLDVEEEGEEAAHSCLFRYNNNNRGKQWMLIYTRYRCLLVLLVYDQAERWVRKNGVHTCWRGHNSSQPPGSSWWCVRPLPVYCNVQNTFKCLYAVAAIMERGQP